MFIHWGSGTNHGASYEKIALIYLSNVHILNLHVIPVTYIFFLCNSQKSKGIWRQQRWENNREIMPGIYLRHEPAFKSYSEACNRDWFWSADLPPPVWKKYWQYTLHWLKIIATMPLPCSNLPLDHPCQGHRVHYTDCSGEGNGGSPGHLNNEQGASLNCVWNKF